MITYFYDVESFPTFVCITFKEKETKKIIQFSIGCGYDQLGELKNFLNKSILLVGFNNISYDNAVIRYLQNSNFTNKLTNNVFELSKRLINDACRRDEDILALRYPRDKRYNWDYLDLFKIWHFDRLGVSLKQIAINLKHEKIQDLPYEPDYHITSEEEVQTVLSYNRNDVDITEKLYYATLPQIELREEIGKLYDVDVMNASDSKMGNIILEHFYQTELGIDTRKLRDLRTHRENVKLAECISSSINFTSQKLIDLKNEIENTIVHAFDGFKYEHVLHYKGTDYSIGSGGIHSMEKSCSYYETTDSKIISCDVGSMYPSCIILNNIYPEHLGEGFVKILSILTAERMSAKKKNKIKADGLKITVNGLYGKLNSNTFWLEDAKAMLSVTISGQLYILMLIEMLEDKGIHCISANTDGIECIVPNSLNKTYLDICRKWEQRTGFVLEFSEFKKYIKRDINSYIALLSNGKIKTKGAFIQEIDLKKGYKHPIVPKAVNEYFLHDVPVEKTVRECTNIMEFCISQKSGSDFQMQLSTIKGIQNLQKNNRFYISKGGGRLQKQRKSNKQIIGLFVGQNVTILNNYDKTIPFEKYNVNTEWYVREAKSFIEDVQPSITQPDMFSEMIEQDWGKKNKLINNIANTPIKKNIKEKEIREANKTRTIFDVPAKYLLVASVDSRYSPTVDFYSFSKGTNNKIKIDKRAFSANPLKTNDVILAGHFQEKNKFIKTKNGFEKTEDKIWWLMDYEIINDFSEFKRK